jgi:hypothetical protein
VRVCDENRQAKKASEYWAYEQETSYEGYEQSLEKAEARDLKGL